MKYIVSLLLAVLLAFGTWLGLVLLLKKINIEFINQYLIWISQFSPFGWILFFAFIVFYYKLIN
jgi:hypothetical protein